MLIGLSEMGLDAEQIGKLDPRQAKARYLVRRDKEGNLLPLE